MTAWNDFVKKIYHEGHDKNPNYMFKQALQDASKRKGEMGTNITSVKSSHSSSMKKKSSMSKKGGRKSKKSGMKSGRKTRSHRKK
jgi:hypothetical protein